jgi:DNA-binding CsgD family transcriptional regulator
MSHLDLTDRQLDIVQLLAEGRSMKEAASVLNLTARTVSFHTRLCGQLRGEI